MGPQGFGGAAPNGQETGSASSGSVGSFASGSGGSNDVGCSADMHAIIDGAGNVVAVCPPDQGCAGAVCMPACKAAAKNHGNVGCDFMTPTPSFYAGDSAALDSPCYAVFIANNWTTPVKITVERAGSTYDPTQFARIAVAGQPEASWPMLPSTGLPQGQVAVLFLAQASWTAITCPVASAVAQSTQVKGTGRGQAWHIAVDAPVSAYDILPYGGAPSLLPSATLLLPTTAWGTNYIGVVPKYRSGMNSPLGGPQWGELLALEDHTEVTIVPTVDLPSGTDVAGAAQNQVTTYSLNAGEYVQWQLPYDETGAGSPPMEMSGTVIDSSAPVAFFGGNGYLCLGSQSSLQGGCDSEHDQFPPVSALGSEYAVAPYATRRPDQEEESIPYRIVGLVDGTQLSYDTPIPGAPATLNRSEWFDFEATGAFVAESQDAEHPFYVGQMMSGWDVTNVDPNQPMGDEDFVNVMASAQFLPSYVFFTDATYRTTTLTVVRKATAGGFQDVTLDCLSAPISGWKPIGSSGKYQWTSIDVVRIGVPNGSCNNGPHSAKSKAAFGLTVWGTDFYASYSYPAGTNISTINTVVIPAQPK